MADAYATFGRFLLLKRRAQDGLGTLWRAGEMERTGFKRIVWLRRFDPTGLDRNALTGTTATANHLAGVIRATNIVRNAAFGTEGGVPYTAWDYVPGQPLDQLLVRAVQEEFPVAIDNALLIVEKLAAALAAASAVEVGGEPLIHGFLVPHLVMVGNDGEAQVAGFGLGRGLYANLERGSLKKLAAPYLAPEVLTGDVPSRRADVHSMGAILYQLLTGKPLPAEPDARAAALEHPSLAFEEGPVPHDVLAILSKTVAARPEDRYASAADFKRELERLLYGGVYSPTTFNLALFMDRLYRMEIEQEDRELERERALDVGAYYQPPKKEAPQATPAQAPEEPKRSHPNLALIIPIVGGAVIMATVIAYLLIIRPTAAPPVDQEAQKRMLQELVNTQVAQALKEKEEQLRKELEAEKARTDELRKQLESQKQRAGGGAKQVSLPEQRRLQQELAAREADQRKKEEELTRVKQQQQAELEKTRAQQAQAEATPTVAPTLVPAAPTAAPTLPPPVPAVPAPEPTLAPPIPTGVVGAPAAAAPAGQVPVTAGLGVAVRESELVDFGQLDVRPEPLVEGKVTLSRNVAMSRVPLSGYVILKVLVNEKGGVDEVTVLRPFSPARAGIDDACVEAVKQNRYRPAMKSGQPVKTWITVTMQIGVQATR
jgi:TonB family protein